MAIPPRPHAAGQNRTVPGEVRPWGRFEVLSDADDCKVKRITVESGQRLSYQRHTHRAEHWFVVAGQGVVVVDGATRHLGAGASIDIPVQAAHRISNDGDVPL